MLLKNTKTMVRYEIEGVKEVLEFNGGGSNCYYVGIATLYFYLPACYKLGELEICVKGFCLGQMGCRGF